MDPRRFEQLERVFQQALARPEAEREAFVRDACGAEASLAEEALAMLGATTATLAIEVDTSVEPLDPAPSLDTQTEPKADPYQVPRRIGEGGREQLYEAMHSIDGTITTPAPESEGSSEPSERALPAEPRPPAQIPNHALLHRIGQGGFGQVWLARNTYTEHFRAAKLLRRDTPLELDGLRTLKQRVGEHPHLLAIDDVGAAGDWLYALMPLADNANSSAPVAVPGEYQPLTLRLKLARSRRLPIDEATQIGAALADALAHLHESGAVHGDVKPENIICHGGAWKLTDYGLMRRSEDDSRLRGFTHGYCPPEGPGTPEADQYALGVLLLELTTGRPPSAAAWQDAASQVLGDIDSTPALASVLQRCLSTDPLQRFPSMKDVAAALRAASGRVSVETRGSLSRGWPWVSAIGATIVGTIVIMTAIHPSANKRDLIAAGGGSIRIEPLVLEQYRYDNCQDPTSTGGLIGDIGLDSWTVLADDSVRLRSCLSRPAYCYVIVFDTNGNVTCPYPQDGISSAEPVAEMQFPGGDAQYCLTDGPGMQAFAVVASHAPLPPYAEWPGRAALEAAWRDAHPESVSDGAPAIWTSDGKALWQQEPKDRGVVVERQTAPGPVSAIVQQLAADRTFEAVRVIAVSVHPKVP